MSILVRIILQDFILLKNKVLTIILIEKSKFYNLIICVDSKITVSTVKIITVFDSFFIEKEFLFPFFNNYK